MADHNIEKFYRPEIFFSDLFRKSIRGQLVETDEAVPFVFRALVLAVDVEGGLLQNEKGSGNVTHAYPKRMVYPALSGTPNPKNSVKARIITDGLDQFISDGDAPVFWPLLPEHITVGVKPGEHVYVFFEDPKKTHGLWISRVPGHEGTNVAPGQDSFKKSVDGGQSLSSKFNPAVKTEDDTGTDQAASQVFSKRGQLSNLFKK